MNVAEGNEAQKVLRGCDTHLTLSSILVDKAD